MKKNLMICALLCLGQLIFAQDAFQDLLFPADFILSHKEAIRLNNRQERQISAIHNENLPLFSKKRLALNDATENLRVLLSAERADEKHIDTQIDYVLSLENELKKIQLQTMLALRNELTNNQIAQLKTIRQNDHASASKTQSSEMLRIRTEGSASERPPAYYINHQGEHHRITDISSIQPKDIESISVFKGETAIEKFGQAGSNGVVIITLKTGKTHLPSHSSDE